MNRTKVEPIKNTWEAVFSFSHGDADISVKESLFAKKGEEGLKEIFEHLKIVPEHPSSGGDEEEWEQWKENASFYIHRDVVYDGQDCKIDDCEYYHYDEDGVKWKLDFNC